MKSQLLRIGIYSLAILAGFNQLAMTQYAKAQNTEKPIPFYIGTYTGGGSQGIYRSVLDRSSGEIAKPQLVAELENASFLAVHPTLPVLYAVSEIAGGGKGEEKQVSAYAVQANGSLKALGGQSAHGDIPCYVAVTASGKFALIANYGSGSVACYPLDEEGKLGKATSTVQHQGTSINKQRQEGPHAHCIVLDPSDTYALSADLGTDEVIIYRLDQTTGTLSNTGKPFKASPGSGPRHLTFHPNGKFVFVINELASTLTACKWDDASGELTALQTESTLPNAVEGNSTAEVLVHPNGRYVYGSNRGHHSLAVFSFDESTGKLTVVGHVPTQGDTPRNFRIDPSGEFLLAENQDTHSIVPFRIDAKSGLLTKAGDAVKLEMPVCIKFYER